MSHLQWSQENRPCEIKFESGAGELKFYVKIGCAVQNRNSKHNKKTVTNKKIMCSNGSTSVEAIRF